MSSTIAPAPTPTHAPPPRTHVARTAPLWGFITVIVVAGVASAIAAFGYVDGQHKDEQLRTAEQKLTTAQQKVASASGEIFSLNSKLNHAQSQLRASAELTIDMAATADSLKRCNDATDQFMSDVTDDLAARQLSPTTIIDSQNSLYTCGIADQDYQRLRNKLAAATGITPS